MDPGSMLAALYDPLMAVSGWGPVRRGVVKGLTGSVLDVGCGTAALAADVGNYTGVDVRLAMLARGRSQRLVCADAAALPFPDRCFDAVISTAFLGLLRPGQRAPVLREMARVSAREIRVLEPVAPLGIVRRLVALSVQPVRVSEMEQAGWRIEVVGPRCFGGTYTVIRATPAGLRS